MSTYNHREIEPKWQKYWAEHHTFKTGTDKDKPNFYALDMFCLLYTSDKHKEKPNVLKRAYMLQNLLEHVSTFQHIR